MQGARGEPIATRDCWKTKPLPKRHCVIRWGERFTDRQMRLIGRGFIPGDMDNRWFLFLEGHTLHIHRSWTGLCVFEVDFEEAENGWVASVVRANRDPRQYTSCDDEEDLRLARDLVRGLLLNEDGRRDDALRAAQDFLESIEFLPPQE